MMEQRSPVLVADSLQNLSQPDPDLRGRRLTAPGDVVLPLVQRGLDSAERRDFSRMSSSRTVSSSSTPSAWSGSEVSEGNCFSRSVVDRSFWIRLVPGDPESAEARGHHRGCSRVTASRLNTRRRECDAVAAVHAPDVRRESREGDQGHRGQFRLGLTRDLDLLDCRLGR